MSTVEKLMVQIFDRKNSIIEQVKRQTELYNQHLASKLLIDGITPPSWLCSPNSSADVNDGAEVNKEELMSKLLRPHPQSSAPASSALYPVYRNPLVAGYKEELSDRTIVDNAAFIGGLTMQEGSSMPTMCNDSHDGCTLTAVPEISVTSPEDQTNERIANMVNASDQSVAGTYGSKSRQQDLELCKSAKAISKSRLLLEKSNDCASNEVRFSLSAANHSCKKDEPQRVEPITPDRSLTVQDGSSIPTTSNEHHVGCAPNAFPETENSVISPEDQTDERILNSLNAAYHSVAGLQRSRSRQKALELRNSAKTLSKSSSHHEKSQDCVSSEIRFSLSAANQSGQKDKLQRVEEVCVSGDEILKNSCLGVDIESGEKEVDNYPGRVSWSISQHKLPVVRGSPIQSHYSDKNSCLGVDIESGEKEVDNYPGRVSWSISQHKLPVVRGSPTQSHYSDNCKVDVSSDFAILRRKDSPNNSDPEKIVVGSKLDGENCLVKDREMDSARIALTKTGVKRKTRSADSTKASGSNNHRRMNTLIMDFGNELIHEFVDRSEGNTFCRDSEAHEPMLGYDKGRQENDTIASLSSTLQNACAFADQPSESSQSDDDILAAKSEISEQHVHDSDMDPDLVRSSLGLDQRVTRSQTRSYPKDTSAPAISNEITSFDVFESDDSPKPAENEDPQNAASSQFTNSCREICDLLNDHGNVSSLSVDELGKYYHSDRCDRSCSNGAEQKNELEIQVARNPSDSLLVVGLQNLNFDKNGELEFQRIRSDFGKRSLNDSSEKMICSLTYPDTSGGFTDQESQAGPCGEGNNELSSDSNSRESMNGSISESDDSCIEKFESRISSGGVIDEKRKLSEQDLKLSSCSEGKVQDQIAESTMDEKGVASSDTCRGLHCDSSSLERISRHASLEILPQLKMRKIEQRKVQSLSAAPSFVVEKPHNLQRNASTSMLNVGNALIDACDINKDVNIEFHPEMDTGMAEAVGCTFSFRDREVDVELCDDEMENIQTRMVSNFTMEKGSQGCFIERFGKISSGCKSDDTRNTSDKQNLENLILTDWMIGVPPPKSEHVLNTRDSALSARSEELEFTDIDESMPVFEGFSVGTETDSSILDHIAGEIDFRKLNSSRSTIERASILAELCKSASLDTPLTCFSSSVEFPETQNVYASTNNVQLDQSEFRNTVPTIDAVEQLPSPTSHDTSNSVQSLPYCDLQPYSASQYGLDLGSRHPSPVKLTARLSSYSGSSGKRLGSSSMPDLMCFPIEEDPTTSEDNDAAFGNRETDLSLVKNCENRQPLQDLTNSCSNPLQPVSGEGKAFGVDKVFRTKSITSGSQNEAQDNPRQCNRKRSVTREKQTSSVADNGGKNKLTFSLGTNQIKIKESATSRLSNRNNIVSNVSSFIPLIQQKQAAAAGPGKRDVKVKALEAAEAAKRFEEKKQNERMMRKEALKLERAKLEEKKLKLMELEKKSKEEERKKKDADKLARKRMREEDERKEKEKKKLRVEQRRPLRELDEKARSEKAEEEKQRLKDAKTNKRGIDIVSEKQPKMETTGGDDLTVRKTETKLFAADLVKAGEVVERSPQTEKMLAHKSKERSYDISPYQCSDDEDDDDDGDDELPTKKYVPSWASKSAVAQHLTLQLEMDSDMIFPRESFCSIEEVIRPRKLQLKIRG